MFLRHCEGAVCFLLPLQCAKGREDDLKVRKKERKPGRVFRGRLAGAGTQGRSLFHFSQHRFGSNYSIHHPFEIYNSIASHQALVTGATCPSPTETKSGSAFSERVDRNGFIQAKKITNPVTIPTGFARGSWKDVTLPFSFSDKNTPKHQTLGASQCMRWMKENILKRECEFVFKKYITICTYLGTELMLHRHLWHSQALQCLIFFNNITYCYVVFYI